MVGTLRFAHPTIPVHISKRHRSLHERSDMRGPTRMSLRSSGLRTCFPFPRHECPSDAATSALSDRGRGEHRMLAAPAGLACKGKCTLRTQATQVQPEQPAFPAQWLYGLYVISSVHRAFWPPSLRVRHTKLDPSVGGSGPHDFAVASNALRLARRCVHRVPRQRS